ncbi:hypothetical protein [Streptomyces sp. NPDC005209]|uniref:hypothetical protein n=1 Tax=Streptomyces sp. NPDC005209 TaxID=3156715 RepID=UPI0033B6CB36
MFTACGLLAVTACSSGGESADNRPTHASASSNPAPATSSAGADSQEAAKAAVLQAYSRYWQEQAKAYAQADIKGTELTKYATKKALTRAMGDVLVMKKAGTSTTGAPGHQSQVTSLTLTGKIPKATLRDCLDISTWKTVKNGKVQPFPSNQPLRYVTTTKAEKWGKQWMITESTPDGSRTC